MPPAVWECPRRPIASTNWPTSTGCATRNWTTTSTSTTSTCRCCATARVSACPSKWEWSASPPARWAVCPSFSPGERLVIPGNPSVVAGNFCYLGEHLYLSKKRSLSRGTPLFQNPETNIITKNPHHMYHLGSGIGFLLKISN